MEYVEGAWRRRLVIDPDNFTFLSDIGRICVQGEGAWRHKNECVALFLQGQSKGPSKFLCTSLLCAPTSETSASVLEVQ